MLQRAAALARVTGLAAGHAAAAAAAVPFATAMLAFPAAEAIAFSLALPRSVSFALPLPFALTRAGLARAILDVARAVCPGHVAFRTLSGILGALHGLLVGLVMRLALGGVGGLPHLGRGGRFVPALQGIGSGLSVLLRFGHRRVLERSRQLLEVLGGLRLRGGGHLAERGVVRHLPKLLAQALGVVLLHRLSGLAKLGGRRQAGRGRV